MLEGEFHHEVPTCLFFREDATVVPSLDRFNSDKRLLTTLDKRVILSPWQLTSSTSSRKEASSESTSISRRFVMLLPIPSLSERLVELSMLPRSRFLVNPRWSIDPTSLSPMERSCGSRLALKSRSSSKFAGSPAQLTREHLARHSWSLPWRGINGGLDCAQPHQPTGRWIVSDKHDVAWFDSSGED